MSGHEPGGATGAREELAQKLYAPISLIQGHSPCRITFLVLSSGAVVESEPNGPDNPSPNPATYSTMAAIQPLASKGRLKCKKVGITESRM